MLALGARGLVNAQFIVRDDGVYLIEVNPRASRTVPFMSKVTGVPMVELAVRISLGETLADLGWPNGLLPPPPFVAVKAPAFSTAKLRGRRPVASGRGCSRPARSSASTTDPRVALAKALLGAALVPPRPGADGRARAALDRRPRQGASCRGWRAALAAAGYRLAATAGTRGGPGGGRVRGAAGRQARRGAGRGRRRGRDPRAHRVGRGPARRQHARRRGPARSATRPRSATRRPPRASCA